MKKVDKLKILVLIITYNSEKWIEKNLKSILQDDFYGDILVIDNGSKDSTLQIVKEKFPLVKVVESKENLGFAKANNLGFKLAQEEDYDFVFLVNHDGWLCSDFWSKANPILSNKDYKDYGLLSPVHLDSTEKKLDFGFEKYAGDSLKKGWNELETIEMINGAFLFISIHCLKEIKGFDPIFFFYGEDIDLCVRAKKRGYKIGVMRDVNVIHDRQERKLTKERLGNHIYANILIQIKGYNGSVAMSFFKGLYSTANASIRWLLKGDNLRGKLYFFLFFKLLSSYNVIKKSVLQYD